VFVAVEVAGDGDVVAHDATPAAKVTGPRAFHGSRAKLLLRLRRRRFLLLWKPHRIVCAQMRGIKVGVNVRKKSDDRNQVFAKGASSDRAFWFCRFCTGRCRVRRRMLLSGYRECLLRYAVLADVIGKEFRQGKDFIFVKISGRTLDVEEMSERGVEWNLVKVLRRHYDVVNAGDIFADCLLKCRIEVKLLGADVATPVSFDLGADFVRERAFKEFERKLRALLFALQENAKDDFVVLVTLKGHAIGPESRGAGCGYQRNRQTVRLPISF
jgi:hypothetical protein